MGLMGNKLGERGRHLLWVNFLTMVLTHGAFPCLHLVSTHCLGEENLAPQVKRILILQHISRYRNVVMLWDYVGLLGFMETHLWASWKWWPFLYIYILYLWCPWGILLALMWVWSRFKKVSTVQPKAWPQAVNFRIHRICTPPLSSILGHEFLKVQQSVNRYSIYMSKYLLTSSDGTFAVCLSVKHRLEESKSDTTVFTGTCWNKC